jgi:hypothetical protein
MNTTCPDDVPQQMKYLIYGMVGIDVISLVASVGMWIWGCFSRRNVELDESM